MVRARVDQRRDSGQPKTERYYVEHVEVSTDRIASNNPLREAITDKHRRGWKLASMTTDPSGDSVELVWDKS